MNKCMLFLPGFILPFGIYTQETITISGKVIDTETKAPLPFAAINIKNTSKGVIANEAGVFDLIVTEGKAIMISTLGYAPKSFNIKSIQDNNQELFELDNQPVLIDEVIVSGERLSGEAILKLAIKNQRKNFPPDNYTLSVFFRETNQINDTYFKLVEAAATIYGKKYPNTTKKVFIEEIRTASNLKLAVPIATEEAYNPFREFQGLIGKISNIRACRSCVYEIEDYITFEENDVAIISSTGTNADYPRIFRYYIDLETFAVIKMEFESKLPFGLGFPDSHKSHKSSLIYLKRTFDYKSYEGRYYLSRYHQQVTHQYNASTSESKSYQTTHNFHVITNNIISGTDFPSGKTDLMNYKNQISETSKSYNSDFWSTYNILRQTPLDEKIISDLSSHKSLENLFTEKNGQ
ncbi:MAG: carboxypeptidase-like regulatory domain-containing protein [Bacteroidota bacterium]